MFNILLLDKLNNSLEKSCGCKTSFRIFFEEEVNSSLRGNVEKQLVKKRPNISRSSISNFFVAKNIYKQSNVEQ